MIICVCRRVSDRDIAREVRAGCRNFDQLQERTGVSTACGACRDCAEEAFAAQVEAACGACVGSPACGGRPAAVVAA